jgi:hypothetical protein
MRTEFDVESQSISRKKLVAMEPMKTRINILFFLPTLTAALLTLLIPRTAPAQTTTFDYTGTETTFTLGPGTYDITAYGAQGGNAEYPAWDGGPGGFGAEMEGQFAFAQITTLTILVSGGGSDGEFAGGGGGGSFVVNGTTPLVVAGGGGGGGQISYGGSGVTGTGIGYGGSSGVSGGGGGFYSSGDSLGSGYGGGGGSVLSGGAGGTGGTLNNTGGGGGGYTGGNGISFGQGGNGGCSYVDSSAIQTITELAGVQSGNGQVDIVAVPEPSVMALLAVGAGAFLVRRYRCHA